MFDKISGTSWPLEADTQNVSGIVTEQNIDYTENLQLKSNKKFIWLYDKLRFALEF